MQTSYPEFIPELFLIDLDGVVYEDGKILDGVHDALNTLDKYGKKFVFITNNSGASKLGLYNKLKSIGVNCNLDVIFASGFMMADYIKNSPEYSNLPIYLISTPELKYYCQELGLDLVDNPVQGMVVVALDFDFNYRKLEQASLSLQRGSLFFVSNIDANFPVPGGLRKPGLGSIVQAIAVASGKQPDLIYGKPYPQMAESILEIYQIQKDKVIILGDSLESDIEMGKRLGIKSALIAQYLPLVHHPIPDYHFKSIKDATDYFIKDYPIVG